MDFQQREQQKKNIKSVKSRYFWGGIATGMGVSLVLVMCSLFVVGIMNYIGLENYSGPKQQIVIQDGQNPGDGTTEIVVTSEVVNQDVIEKMQDIEQVIDECFYQEDIDKEAMVDAIYKGMVSSLGDPYSEYFTTEELEELIQGIEGVYYGIGCYVSLDTSMGLAKISGIISGAPAEEVDIRPNDYIYAVDGVETYGMTLNEVVALIKGPEGTKVLITFLRDGEYLDIEVERRKVVAPTVETEMFDSGIAYIQISEFDEVTIEQFADALKDARKQDMKGLIIDLRANPGGSLNAVVEISKQLLPKGLIVYTEDREGNRKEYSCDGKKELEVPLVVLIDGNSASASEILAGAIKDYGIGTLVGTNTFGKGIVQQAISLGDGTAVKLTISTYYSPNGNNIHGEGVAPDVVCEFDGERYYSEEAYDNQLEKAKEVLQGLIRQAE